jgi:hypothetical protein
MYTPDAPQAPPAYSEIHVEVVSSANVGVAFPGAAARSTPAAYTAKPARRRNDRCGCPPICVIAIVMVVMMVLLAILVPLGVLGFFSGSSSNNGGATKPGSTPLPTNPSSLLSIACNEPLTIPGDLLNPEIVLRAPSVSCRDAVV